MTRQAEIVRVVNGFIVVCDADRSRRYVAQNLKQLCEVMREIFPQADVATVHRREEVEAS